MLLFIYFSFLGMLGISQACKKDLLALKNSRSKKKYYKDEKYSSGSRKSGGETGQRQAAMMQCSELYLKSKSLGLKCISDSAALSALGVSSWQCCSASGTCFPGSSRHLCLLLGLRNRTCLPAAPPSAKMLFPHEHFYKEGNENPLLTCFAQG